MKESVIVDMLNKQQLRIFDHLFVVWTNALNAADVVKMKRWVYFTVNNCQDRFLISGDTIKDRASKIEDFLKKRDLDIDCVDKIEDY